MTGRGRGRGGPRGGGPGGGGGGGGGDRGGGGRGASPARGGAGRGGGRGGGPPSETASTTHGGTVSSAGRGRGSDRGGGGGGGGFRGGPRGGGGGRGGGPPPPPGGPVQGAPSGTNYNTTAVSIARHVKATGMNRPSFGTAGKQVDIIVNAYHADLPKSIIHHYDVTIVTEKTLPARANMPIIRAMQDAHPNVFTTRAVFDGKKNLYSTVAYSFGDAQEFQFNSGGMNWKVRLQKAATINPEILARYVNGNANWDEAISTYLNACNVAVRMQPIETHPFNTRSFFTRAEYRDVGKGFELWRGYFQSVRPAIGRMVINVDISTAVFFKSGPLIRVILDFLGYDPNSNPTQYLTSNIQPRVKQAILKHIRGLNVRTERAGQTKTRVIKGLSDVGADAHRFQGENGQTTISAYFSQTTGRNLQYPTLLSVQLSTRAFVPLERCEVVPGQMLRRTIPPEITRDMVEFSTMRPENRLASIQQSLQVLQYGNSRYLRDFGIDVSANPLRIKGRILQPPTLQYAGATIQPSNGQWNMVGKKLFRPATIVGVALLVFDARFRAEQNLKQGLHQACNDLGIIGMPADFPVIRINAQGGNYSDHFKRAAAEVKRTKGVNPNLILAIMPDFGGEDVYKRMKHAGDIDIGVATQCLKGSKVFKANNQYWANVCLKINVKLGGINVIPQANAVRMLMDPSNPTLVIGADVQHPGPGSVGRPSFAAVTGNVDGTISKYVAISRPQKGRVEMIQELDKMVAHVLNMYIGYRSKVEKAARPAPKRIIFYRDGVSEGQFAHCLEQEVPKIIKACKDCKLQELPKLTFVVVGKRHHIRFFPMPGSTDKDKSGNVTAGLVVDRDITSPVEYDFYLQSHGGLLGTSRSAHYNVLVDDNNFGPDDLQKMSFALCHVYARSTRSVSIVPPVYYADTICERAKFHYNPDSNIGDLMETDTSLSSTAANNQEQRYMTDFRPLHPATQSLMYFQ